MRAYPTAELAHLVAEVIDHSGLPHLTMDVDGSAVTEGLRVEGARGFNPHRAQRCPPITRTRARCSWSATVPVTCTTARRRWRLAELFEQLHAALSCPPVLAMRMDRAFFQATVFDVLQAEGAM